jgi:choline dehydrogenase
MFTLWNYIFLALLFFSATAFAQNNTYDYIVVGSGPGGGPLAANLAKAGNSVLLLEAGDDRGDQLDQEIIDWAFLAFNDPLKRWDFFVKYHSDNEITLQDEHLTWRTTNGGFFVGTNPPPDSTQLGI